MFQFIKNLFKSIFFKSNPKSDRILFADRYLQTLYHGQRIQFSANIIPPTQTCYSYILHNEQYLIPNDKIDYSLDLLGFHLDNYLDNTSYAIDLWHELISSFVITILE